MEVLLTNVGKPDDNILETLEVKANTSRTAKLWLDCFVKPVLLAMLFVRAECEADWLLHIVAVQNMLPYFFVAGHSCTMGMDQVG